MASQERLEYFISAAFKDEGVRQAMQAFGKLNAESAKVVREMERISQAAGRAGQQIRDSRTPYAQLGMQVNQLGTQLASGTSFAVAFAQQIGDVGWALQNANGILGTVGNFLKGPWGAAIAIGATALGPLITKLFETKDAAKEMGDEAENALKKLFNSLKTTSAGTDAFTAISKKRIQALGDEARAIREVQAAEENFKAVSRLPGVDASIAGIKLAEAQARLANARARIEESDAEIESTKTFYRVKAIQDAKQKILETDPNKGAAKKAREYQTLVNQSDALQQSLQSTINSFTSESNAIGRAKNQLKEFNDAMSDLAKLPGGQAWLNANVAALESTKKALEDGANGVTEWKKVIAKSNEKELPDWQKRLNDVNQAYNNLDPSIKQSIVRIDEFRNAVSLVATDELNKLEERIDNLKDKDIDPVKALNNELMDLSELLSGGAFGEFDVSVVTNQMDRIKAKLDEVGIQKRNADIAKSFESIGMSVNDAFKGMLTAGMSWKDGMKGIINAVIAELWRLFVVQQIVGFVSNTLGSVFGISKPTPGGSAAFNAAFSDLSMPPQFANGTTSAPGGMAWVGERGPELVNLPRGASVIPAHRASQMGGGGVTVNVDARGSADPAAVRAQVQQGILEAAPAIIAAAEQKTVMGLRRPRLGGVMQ